MEIFAIFLNEVPTNLKLFMKYLEFGGVWYFKEGNCKYLIFWSRVSLVKWSLQSPLLIVILLLKLGTGDKLYYLTSPMQSWVYKWSRYFGKNSSLSSIFYSFSQFHSDLWKIRVPSTSRIFCQMVCLSLCHSSFESGLPTWTFLVIWNYECILSNIIWVIKNKNKIYVNHCHKTIVIANLFEW